jgi:hypothetical protein
MELKAGRLSEVITLRDHRHITVTLAYGSLKLFLKGKAGIKICFFSSIREHLNLDVTDYETLVLEAFDDCSYTLN